LSTGRGQNSREFIARLLARGFARAIEPGPVRRGPLYHVYQFAERILPRASDLLVQATLDYKQRLQQLFFPEGIAYDGIRFNRTVVTAPLFNYLAPDQTAEEILVSQEGIVPAGAGRRAAPRA
jgi:hypothetical protein